MRQTLLAGTPGEHDDGATPGRRAALVLVTHTALERDMQATVAELRELDSVDRVGILLRVIGGEQ